MNPLMKFMALTLPHFFFFSSFILTSLADIIWFESKEKPGYLYEDEFVNLIERNVLPFNIKNYIDSCPEDIPDMKDGSQMLLSPREKEKKLVSQQYRFKTSPL